MAFSLSSAAFSPNGAIPPIGCHRYYFKLYDTDLRS